jgi:RNA polymerase sigma factor for flagellar operon FliA
LIEQNLPLVRYIARTFARQGMSGGVSELDDLVSWGTVGLIQAVNRFEGSRGKPFAAFAAIRIRGAIIDGLRQMDGVSRTVRRDARDVERVTKSFAEAVGREPMDEEARQALGWTAHRYESVISISSRKQISLDEVWRVTDDEYDSRRSEALADPDGEDLWRNLERTQTIEAVRKAVRRLPERERDVLRMLYLEGLNIAAVAQAMGVSSSRICQLKQRSFMRLRADSGLREVA